MKILSIYVRTDTPYRRIEEQARRELSIPPEVSLVAWYDGMRRVGGPLEPCSHEPRKCVRDYAMSRGADFQVTVNGGAFEFFYARPPRDVQTLDRAGVASSHAGLPQNEFDNLQGG